MACPINRRRNQHAFKSLSSFGDLELQNERSHLRIKHAGAIATSDNRELLIAGNPRQSDGEMNESSGARNVRLRLTIEEYEKLQELCSKTGVRIAQIARQAITHFMTYLRAVHLNL
jgi:hypothetical protein